MASLETVTLEVTDLTAADAFHTALGLNPYVKLRAAQASTIGFRGFALSLVVSQPANADAFIDAALDAGATVLKPATKGFWGYGGVVRAPDGTICKIATSKKKDTGPAVRELDQVALLLGVTDVKASRRFYTDRGLTVAKSFGGKYVEFDTASSVVTASSAVTLALYPRHALAKDIGIPLEGAGSHPLVLGSVIGPFTDPDGYAWETT